MSAIVPSNGVLTFTASTQTFTPVDGGAKMFQAQALNYYGSAASHLVLKDTDGVTLLELGIAAVSSKELDAHYFVGLRPWKCPIQPTTITAGSRLRIYV
jgi:hypothetical protein